MFPWFFACAPGGAFKEPEKADIDPQKVNIALLRKMAEHGVIEPVVGYGKGKYRFRQQER